MSVARSSECLLCSFSRLSRRSPAPYRRFHSSPGHQKRKPRFPSVKAESAQEFNIVKAARQFPGAKGTPIPEQYSPEQRAAIEAAQKLINVGRLTAKTGMRTDPWRMQYYDDLTKIDPVVDRPVRAPWTNLDDNSRVKEDEELEDDFIKFASELPDSDAGTIDGELWDRFDKNLRLTVGPEAAERNPPTALAPDLPRISEAPKPKKMGKDGKPASGSDATISPAMIQMMQMTGLSQRQLSQLRVKTIFRNQVTNQTRLGKISKEYALSVAGNMNGMVGIGEGKAADMGEARRQSQFRAIRNMAPVLRYEGRTVFGDVDAKVSATKLELYARPPGFGLRCQKYIWEICKCAGIHDLAARVTRARNPMNMIKATYQALMSQKDPEDIARARGKKMVDVRKVYYAGQI